MIFAAPVDLGMSSQKYPAVKNVQALLHQISRVLGDKYDPANPAYNGGSAMQGNVDSPTVWATYLIVRDGVAQIPAIGSLIGRVIGAIEDVGLLNYGNFKRVYLSLRAENWINPEYAKLAGQIDSALRGALARLPSAGSGGTQVPREIIQQVAQTGYRITYPSGTFAIRDPGKNTYRIFTPIV